MYIANRKLADKMCGVIMREAQSEEGGCVCGFDIEWRVTFQIGDVHKTALVHVCRPAKCYLFHLAAMGMEVPEQLRALLADPHVRKVRKRIELLLLNQ